VWAWTASTFLAWPRAGRLGRGAGGGFRGDDGCTPSLGLSVDTEFSRLVRDSDSPLVWVAQKPRGGSPGSGRLGFTWGWVLPMTAWPAGRLRWPALTGRLPMGVRGSHGSYVELGSTPFLSGMSNHLVGAI